MLKTARLLRYLWLIENSEEQHLSEIEIYCNIKHLFIITDQYKASLLNKSITFCKSPSPSHLNKPKQKN